MLGATQLESKDDMKARHLSSPDHADALAFTFASPVTMQATSQSRQTPKRGVQDYDVLRYDAPRGGSRVGVWRG
jgi:hypothetical protein